MRGHRRHGFLERMNASLPHPTALLPPRVRRWSTRADLVLVLALFVLYLGSFVIDSPVHGPAEIFGQDSGQILRTVSRAESYPWNPQNHLLYHSLVEAGYRVWSWFAGNGPLSAFYYLKFFTALTGLGFLLAFRWLLCELGLGTSARAVILALSGLSVTAWFHFGAFESHCLTMPWLALYLVALLRLTRQARYTATERILLIVSLVALGWTRVEAFRFALVSVVLLVLPGLRGFRRPLARDLMLVLPIFLVGNAALGHLYLDRPLDFHNPLASLDTVAGTVAFERWDRPSLDARLRRAENLSPRHLSTVGRVFGVYSILMPIGDPADGPTRGRASPDERELGKSVDGGTSGWLFLQPAHNLLPYPVSCLALLGLTAILSRTLLLGIRRMADGDAFLTVLTCQWLVGWLLYTWFNPFEPFLWAVGFMPLLMAAIADTSPTKSRGYWLTMGVFAVAVAVHNWRWFYLEFR